MYLKSIMYNYFNLIRIVQTWPCYSLLNLDHWFIIFPGNSLVPKTYIHTQTCMNCAPYLRNRNLIRTIR